jgi:two-component system sensor histidine kinase PrrB
VLTARRGQGLNAERGEGGADVLTIVVDDNGRGLPAEEHENVMGRFARGSTAAQGGSGLGLALVAQQATLHGGGIELSDSPLGGLRATLTLATSTEPGPDRPGDALVNGAEGRLRRRASRVAGWRSPPRQPPRS